MGRSVWGWPGLYWLMPTCAGPLWSILGSAELCRSVLGCAGLYRATQDSAGPHLGWPHWSVLVLGRGDGSLWGQGCSQGRVPSPTAPSGAGWDRSCSPDTPGCRAPKGRVLSRALLALGEELHSAGQPRPPQRPATRPVQLIPPGGSMGCRSPAARGDALSPLRPALLHCHAPRRDLVGNRANLRPGQESDPQRAAPGPAAPGAPPRPAPGETEARPPGGGGEMWGHAPYANLNAAIGRGAGPPAADRL